MSASLQTLLFTVLAISKQVIHAQSDEQYFVFNFSGKPSNWYIEQSGGGVSTSSNTGDCPSNTACWEMVGLSLANTTLTTFGYHNIRIMIDVAEKGLDNDEWCYLQYKTPIALSWKNFNLITIGDDVVSNYQILLNSDYNNQQLFYIKLGNSGVDNNDYCYFDNLKLFGIPYTYNPTTDSTNHPTIDPTKDPTNDPTTDPTVDPTVDPTTNPITMMPTKQTDFPTTDPTVDPTTDPTNDPTNDPTTDPSTDPTIDPTMNPTKDSTSDPTNDPTKDPTQSQLSAGNKPTGSPTFSPIPQTTKTVSNENTETNGKSEKAESTEIIDKPIVIIMGISIAVICLICIGIGLVYRYKTPQPDMNKSDSLVNKVIEMTNNDESTEKEGGNDDTHNDDNNVEDVLLLNGITAGGPDTEHNVVAVIMDNMERRNKTEEFGRMINDNAMVQGLVMDDILDEMEANNVDDIHITAGGIDGMEENNDNDDDDDDDDVLMEVNAVNITATAPDDKQNNNDYNDDEDDILDELDTIQ